MAKRDTTTGQELFDQTPKTLVAVFAKELDLLSRGNFPDVPALQPAEYALELATKLCGMDDIYYHLMISENEEMIMRKYYLLPDVEKKKYLELLIDAGKSASLSSDEALDSYLRQVAEGEERRVDLERLSSIRGMLLAAVVLIAAWNLPVNNPPLKP